jgi:hypothetical protein
MEFLLYRLCDLSGESRPPWAITVYGIPFPCVCVFSGLLSVQWFDEEESKMEVQRTEWQVKRGHVQEALALLREAKGKPNMPKLKRVYTCRIGQMSRIAYELEWESLGEWQRFLDAWNKTPEATEFWKKWDELVDVGSQEDWVLVDL